MFALSPTEKDFDPRMVEGASRSDCLTTMYIPSPIFGVYIYIRQRVDEQQQPNKTCRHDCCLVRKGDKEETKVLYDYFMI